MVLQTTKQDLISLPTRFRITRKELQEMSKYLRDLREAVVLTHIGPDQDAMMSLSAWSYILSINTTAVIRPIYEEELLHEVADMPNLQTVEHVGNIYDAIVRYEPSHVFLVDINHVHRLTKSKHEQLKDYLENKTTTIVIDHHETPMDFKPAFKIIKPMASNAELLFYIARLLSLEVKDAAQDLLIGILADTGLLEFAQQENRPAYITTQAVYELSKYPNIDMRDAVKRAQMMLTPDLMPFIQEFLSNLKVEKDFAYTFADHSQLTDAETVPARRAKSYVLQAVLAKLDVPVYYIISQNDTKVKVSLRSRPPFSIRAIAEKLGGGGHDFASGAYIQNANMQDIITQLNHEIQIVLKEQGVE